MTADFAKKLIGLMQAGARPAHDRNMGKKWTDAGLAEATGVSARSVNAWRNGKSLPHDVTPIIRAFFGSIDSAERDELLAEYSRARHKLGGEVNNNRLSELEQTLVIEYFRENKDQFGIKTTHHAAHLLVQESPELEMRLVVECLHRRSISRESRERVARAVVSFLRKQIELIERDPQLTHESRAYLLHVLGTSSDQPEALKASVDVSADQNTTTEHVLSNWRSSHRRGNSALRTGIYQMFRRYKPTVQVSPVGDQSLSNPADHVVICELLYIDADALDCRLVSSNLNLYFGSLFINHENNLFGILQRRTSGGGINQRLMALKLESRRLPIYSGLTVHSGDTTLRPVAAECLFVPVGASHEALYEEIARLVKEPWTGGVTPNIPEDSVIAEYVSTAPPFQPYESSAPEWQRVKFVRDFPVLLKLAQSNYDGVSLFQEPLRTLSFQDLAHLSVLSVPSVFRQSRE